jgi:transposase
MRSARFHNQVLDLWAQHSAGELALRFNVSRNVILSVVRRARERGDERAIPKPEGSFPRKGGWWRAGCPKTTACWQAGIAARRS